MTNCRIIRQNVILSCIILNMIKLNFADTLKELRNDFGITQLDLGKKIGYTQASISKWENGDRIPSVNDLITVANFFGVDLDYFTKDSTEINSTKNKKSEK